MRKVPGGLLLIPMLVSALVNTFTPNLFSSLGSVSQALFTTKGINCIVGIVCFCSGTGIDLQRLIRVLKKQGILVLIKMAICMTCGYLFIKFFGLNGVWGINAIAFIAAICSTNPSLYLVLEQDYGTEDDLGAFGLVSLLCVPAYPLLVFSISQATAIDWTPIISVIVPIALGMLIGNLDKDMAEFFKPGILVITPFMGWVFGAGINLIDAVKAGPQGVLITIIFYILLFPIMITFERKVMKTDGIASVAMGSIAGMSVSVPTIIAASSEAYAQYVTSATAQIAFGVVLTSIITPIVASRLYKHDHQQLPTK